MNRREFFRHGVLAGAAGAAAGRTWSPLPAAAQGEGASGIRAGLAESDISPEPGMERPGGYGKAFHETFHDPCKVRAAVFDDGATRLALAGTDTLIIPRRVVEEARQEIHRRCGIPPEAILIGASHSHSAGPVGMVQPGEYAHASALVRELAYQKSSCADAAYLQRVRREIVWAVCQAHASRQEVLCGFGSGREEKAAYNRRFRMRNGLTYTHPGKGNPEIVKVAGPIDPEVGVVGVWNREGRLLGCIVHYACHATTGPGGISADWIYYLEQTIRGALDPEAVVVFLQGASGDVTQVDNLSPYANPSGEAWARFVGGRVGAEAVKVLLSVHPGQRVPLATRTELLEIPRRPPSPGCAAVTKSCARSPGKWERRNGPSPRRSCCWMLSWPGNRR